MVVRFETPRRCAGDEGAALVEAAFVTPVLLFLLLGILESGLLFRTYMTLGSATQDGARSAAIQGNAHGTDYEVIQRVQKAMSAVPQSSIRNLVVFKANANPAIPPAQAVPATACSNSTSRTYSAAGFCNTYVPATDWNVPVAQKNNYDCPNPPFANGVASTAGYSQGWCPGDRRVALTGANSPPDYVGVYISVNHQYVSKLFGTTKLLSDRTIARLEPQQLTS